MEFWQSNWAEANVAVTDDLFTRTFRDSPIGMVILDSRGRYLEVNEAFAKLIGRPCDRIQGRHFSEFTHSDDVARDLDMLGMVGSGELPSYQVDKRMLDGAGDTVWARVTVSAIHVDDDPNGHHFVAQVEDVTEMRRAKDLLDLRSLYDGLTGLPNRTLLLSQLATELDGVRAGRGVACCFLDLDHFKTINDSLGHDAGDLMLVEAAERLRRACRPGDIVARLGGDEFVVIADAPDLDAAMELAQSLEVAVSSTVSIDHHEISPTASIGVAWSQGVTTAESLVRNADTAMYVAKQAGRARIVAYEPTMRETALMRLSIEAELRTAIREGELAVHYQPVVDLASRRIVALEALVRWQHPTRGLLPPDEFIPVSEDANLVIPLGAAVIRQACEFLASSPEFDGTVFVNVSTKQIGTADLARVVKAALEDTGADASRLGLEITESGMLMANASSRADLGALSAMGVSLLLDDFGTGYSALSSVLLGPMTGIKLAREFTLRLGDRGTGDRISRGIAALATSLGMLGIIEGIETEAQYAMALKHGWQLGQGFLFGRAVPQTELPALIAANSEATTPPDRR